MQGSIPQKAALADWKKVIKSALKKNKAFKLAIWPIARISIGAKYTGKNLFFTVHGKKERVMQHLQKFG